MQMAGWMAEGKLKHRDDIVEGFEHFPDALQRLFKGENIGKRIVQVSEVAQ
jgi:NADPH-dependent curcumin reductase CurA